LFSGQIGHIGLYSKNTNLNDVVDCDGIVVDW